MSTRNLIAVLLVLPLVTASAHAQSYTLKIKGAPDVGKSVTVKENAKVNIAFSVAIDNNVLKEEKKVEESEKQYVEKALAANDKGQPTKFSRAYSKALKGDEGNLDKLSYDGKTIVFERKNGKFEASALGGDVEEKDINELLKSVNNKDDAGFAPKNAVKVGDTWTLPKEALGSFLGELKDGADFDKFKGQGKLVKAYMKDGKQWGTLDIALAVPVKKFGPLDLDKGIPFELKLTLDTAIDGSSTANQIKGTLKVEGKSQFEQNGQTVMLDVSVMAVIRRDYSAEK
jgi:hypothetical protein